MIASNDDSESAAAVEWARIAFVESALVGAYLSPEETEMTVPAGQATQIPLAVPFPDARASRRIDYEFQDSENNGYTLYYYR